MTGVFVPEGRALAVLGGAATVLVAVSLFTSSSVIRYGAWLTVFTLWMAWFVLAAVGWLRNADV